MPNASSLVDTGSPDALARVLRMLQTTEQAVAAAAILAAAAALMSDLLGREVFGHGIFGAQRVAVHLTWVAGMLGFVLAIGSGAHLRVKATDALLPPRWSPALDRAGSLLSALLLLALAWHAARFVLETHGIGERSTTLGIPIWPIQAVMVYAFLSAALRYALYALRPGLRPAGADAK